MAEIFVVKNKLSDEVHYYHPDIYSVETRTVNHVEAGKVLQVQQPIQSVKHEKIEDFESEELFTLKTLNPIVNGR
jgi:hypothetical protein